MKQANATSPRLALADVELKSLRSDVSTLLDPGCLTQCSHRDDEIDNQSHLNHVDSILHHHFDVSGICVKS